jgi:hypothetical protein
MTLVVDTVLLGDQILSVPQPHPDFDRVDLVVLDLVPQEDWKSGFNWVSKLRGRIRYVVASVQIAPGVLTTPLPSNVRVLSRVYVHKAATFINQRNIEEVELHGLR